MEFKNIKNITDEGEATMLLYSEIGADCGINGQYFAEEISWLQDNCKLINVRINSSGGSIVDGYSIVTSILNSKVPVNTYIDGLAASMAGIIAMCGEKVYMNDYALFMMHNPSGGSDEVLQYFKDTLVTILTKRTNISAEEISSMMDKETWLNSIECKSKGLVDEVIKTQKKVKVKTSSNHKELMNIFNKLINDKNKNMDLIINKLSLSDDANEETIVNSIGELQGQRDKLMEDLENAAREKEELENKFKDLEAAIEAFNKEKADLENAKIEAEKLKVEEMVNTFIKAAKIKVEDKAKYINLATLDFETTKDMLERVGIKPSINVTDLLNLDKPTNDGRENWTHRDYEMKDPKALEKMKNETPEVWQRLFDAEYKK